MKIIMPKQEMKMSPVQFMRRAGYSYIEPRHSGQGSFVRRMGSTGFPRFHVYINDEGDRFIFDLHLDQKRPSYQSVRAHSGEHDGQAVEGEARRLKNMLG